jgi:hypothetical protein
MKTLGRNVLWAACAVFLASLSASAAGKAKTGTEPASSPVATPPRADGVGMDGGVVGNNATGTGPGARGGQNNACGNGAWGRRGPDADGLAKMKRAEQAERRAVELGAKLRDAAPGDQAAVKAELRKAVGEAFDARMAVAEAEAAAIEQRATSLRARLEKKKAMREAIVDRHVDEISGDDEDDWN